MANSVRQMMDDANAAVPRIAPAEVQALIAKGDAVVIDVREPQEVEQSGKVSGAINISRGMLEFRADAQSPYHDPRLATGKTIILYCASGARSALGGKLLKDMGYERVFNLGGFRDWEAAGGAVEKG